MTADGFRYEPYEWRGQTEWVLRHGMKSRPHVFIISPLFEEMNFTRAFNVDLARELALRGIGSSIPDLPGAGESLHDLSELGWADWRDAVRVASESVGALCGSLPYIAALRGGTLLADAAEGQAFWSFAPVSGASLLRQLERTQHISTIGDDATRQSSGERHFLAGYSLSSSMRDGLAEAEPSIPQQATHRIVPAASYKDRPSLWRRAEPAKDGVLSQHLAQDLSTWIGACEGR